MESESVETEGRITADMTLLEVLSQCRQTEEVFRRWETEAGVCLCCVALFDTLAETAEKYRLDLEALLRDLEEKAASVSPAGS